MKKLFAFVAIFIATSALGAGPQPCYFSGQYVKCFPPAGISGVDGTVSLPSYTFTSDPDSGLYRIGANDLGIAVNGALTLETTTTGIKTASVTWTDTTKGIVGTVTNDDAASTYVGEYKETKTAQTNVGATGNYFDAGSTTLTAGDWDCYGIILYIRNSATFSAVFIAAGISGTTGNSTTGLAEPMTLAYQDLGAANLTFNAFTINTAIVRVQSNGTNLFINGTTTSSSQVVYLKGSISAYSVATPQYRSIIRCRRVR